MSEGAVRAGGGIEPARLEGDRLAPPGKARGGGKELAGGPIFEGDPGADGADGLNSLVEDALRKVYSGLTTLEELRRVVPVEQIRSYSGYYQSD